MTFESLPTSERLMGILGSLRGRKVGVVAIADVHGRPMGNNGDQLMHRIAAMMIDEAGATTAPLAKIVAPDELLVPPNGAMLERFVFPELLRSRIAPFPDVPLTILPSSAWFPTRNPARLFEGRRARTTWILREPESLGHLEQTWGRELAKVGVELVLDHDVVVTGRHHLAAAIGQPVSGDYLLAAARRDGEAVKGVDVPLPSDLRGRASRAVSALPGGNEARRLFRWYVDPDYAASSRKLLADLPLEQAARFAGTPRLVCGDVSSPKFASYSRYARLVRGAGAVYTNRLHVALPASLLGKPVVLKDTGYHKLSGVYHHSLAGLKNVRFLA